MIRTVLDTNIVVSGLLWLGAPSDAIDAAIEEQFVLLSSEPLVAELTRVLSRPKFEPRFEKLGKSVE
ncbi:MAG: putative toxin-antitoxin system toxin component, PIN family, partial [Chloroflexota bacterium]